MNAFYNEIDRYCCDWLSNLMDAGYITPGKIDDRSIADVSPDDVRGYGRVHYFAGIAGWDHALNLAGWGDRPIWTGSCPCQPFSAAGKGAAADDERHLWPDWFRLIRAVRPPVIFGEQVEAAIGWGWLDAVCSDLEAEGYATGAAVLPACGVGAPHRRDRLWFVAQSGGAEWRPWRPGRSRANSGGAYAEFAGSGDVGLLADARGLDLAAGAVEGRPAVVAAEPGGAQHRGTGLLADTDAAGQREQRRGGLFDGEREAQRDDADGCGEGELGNADGGEQRRTWQPSQGNRWEGSPGGSSPWSDLVWLPCSDGKARPTESTLQRMAAGLSDSLGYVCAGEGYVLSPLVVGGKNRVGKLRAYGNAIVPALAAEFVKAAMVADTDYDARADLAGSIKEGLAAIRERIAAGGPTWTPRGPRDVE